MEERAAAMGANAVVGIDIDYEVIRPMEYVNGNRIWNSRCY